MKNQSRSDLSVKEIVVMKELVLSRQYAVIALDGLESLHPSMAKSAVIRAIAAAKVMEEVMHTEAESDPAVFIPKLNEACCIYS